MKTCHDYKRKLLLLKKNVVYYFSCALPLIFKEYGKTSVEWNTMRRDALGTVRLVACLGQQPGLHSILFVDCFYSTVNI